MPVSASSFAIQWGKAVWGYLTLWIFFFACLLHQKFKGFALAAYSDPCLHCDQLPWRGHET